MPNTITEQQEQELYSNAYKLGHVFVKSIRYDEKDFWASFLIGVLEDKYVQLGMPLDKIRVPLRKGEFKDFKVTQDGVVEVKKYTPQYTLAEKQGFSKKQSVSVVSMDKKYYPPVFGHDKDRHEELVGVMFFSDKIEKNSKSSHVLPSIIMSYDGGTVGRPYYFELLEEAEKYFKNKTQEQIWHDSVQALIEADKISNKNLERHNEILARLKWTGESKCQIGIFADNLKSRLIAQLRAIDVKNNTGQNFVPISFYISTKESGEKIYPYYLEDQAKDLELALNDKSVDLKAIGLCIYFLNLNGVDDNQQAYDCLISVFDNDELRERFWQLLLCDKSKKITEICRKIILNNVNRMLESTPWGISNVSSESKRCLLFWVISSDNNTVNLYKLLALEDPDISYELAVAFAVYQGHDKVAKLLLSDSNFDCNKINKDGETPLLMAVICGNIEIVELLLSNSKIDCNKTGPYKKPPLLEAVTRGHLEIVRLLLSNSTIDCNGDGADYNHRETPIHIACSDGNIEIFKLLLSDPRIDCNKVDPYSAQKTLLLKAVCMNNIEIVKLLLSDPRIDCNQVNDYGQTPLAEAVIRGNIEIVKLLLTDPRIDCNKADNCGRTPLVHAVFTDRNGDEIVKLLLLSDPKIDCNKVDDRGRTPLVDAVRLGRTTIVELLLNKLYFNPANNSNKYLDDLEQLINEANALQYNPKKHKEMLELLNKYKNQKNDNIQSPNSPTLKPRM